MSLGWELQYALPSALLGVSVGGLIVVWVHGWWDALTPLGRVAVPLVLGLFAFVIGGIVRYTS